jgi:apolipoprotein N-acyltransferase
MMKQFRIGFASTKGLGMAGAALMGAAAFPPLGLWPLSLVSVVVFLLLLRDEPSATARSLGLLYGSVYGLSTMYWFFGIFGVTAIGLIAIMAAYFGLLATLIGMTRGLPTVARCLLVALFAVAVEWLRGDAWYLRFPWYTVPHALAAAPAWIAVVRWIGTYGLTYAVWLIAGAGVWSRAPYWLAFLLLPACSWLLPEFAPPDRMAVLVQVEQPNPVDPILQEIPTTRCDLVVLPEYAYPRSLQSTLALKHGPVTLARRLGCPVVYGTVEGEFGEPDFQNVAAVLDADGRLVGTFPKQRPVPLMVDGRPGTRRPVFSLEQGTLGVGICYDLDAPAIAASLVRAGATVLVVPSEDSMSWGRAEHLHHELLLRLRAVESDRWILRATSSGRSEAVDPHGVPSDAGLPIGDVGFVSVGFAHRSTFTLGSYADFLGPLAAALTVVFLLERGLRSLILRLRKNRGQAR